MSLFYPTREREHSQTCLALCTTMPIRLSLCAFALGSLVIAGCASDVSDTGTVDQVDPGARATTAVTADSQSRGEAAVSDAQARPGVGATSEVADATNGSPSPPHTPASQDMSTEQATSGEQRLDALQEQVSAWAAATDLPQAQEAAEGARNLIVGPDGPYYGDATDDGQIVGASNTGLLPGLDGQDGIASAARDNQCVVDDVLGGSWEDPQRRWDILDTAVAEWSTTSNPFPTLPSHPQRVVGWATLTLETDDLQHAIEFAGHARLHVDVSRRAYDCR